MKLPASIKAGLRWLLVVFMVGVGVLHFVDLDTFLGMIPPFLPWPELLIYLSGAFEIGLGLALIPARTRALAGWGCIALYVAVFPANIYMAIYQVPFRGDSVEPWILWARLPLQLVFMIWAYAVSRPNGQR